MAALLMPGLAHGANPTADLSVQIVPAGSAPAVPAAAQAAGFTTLALNADFSQPEYAGSSWFDCGGSENTDKVWHQDDQLYNDGFPPCSDIVQVNDGGNIVLDLIYRAGQTPHWQALTTKSYDGNHSISYPFTGYWEIEYSQAAGINNNFTDWWSSCTGLPSCPAGNLTLELDYSEQSNGFGDSGYHNWAVPGGCGGHDCVVKPNNLNTTQYHKWAGLVTTDGTTVWFCSLYDGSYNFCTTVQHTSDQINGVTGRNFAIISNGKGDVGQPMLQDSHMYIKSVRIWECANWQTSMCYGPLVHN